jgi:soluble lytic murein transglycosylase-like protein
VDVAPLILKHANDYQVDPYLVQAVMSVESNFHNSARSWCGATGLMQLMPTTGRMMGARNLLDPEQNIAAGTRYLAGLLQRYDGRLEPAVAAYNAGPGNVPKSGKIPNIAETRRYVVKVMKAYNAFKEGASIAAP